MKHDLLFLLQSRKWNINCQISICYPFVAISGEQCQRYRVTKTWFRFLKWYMIFEMVFCSLISPQSWYLHQSCKISRVLINWTKCHFRWQRRHRNDGKTLCNLHDKSRRKWEHFVSLKSVFIIFIMSWRTLDDFHTWMERAKKLWYAVSFVQ